MPVSTFFSSLEELKQDNQVKNEASPSSCQSLPEQSLLTTFNPQSTTSDLPSFLQFDGSRQSKALPSGQQLSLTESRDSFVIPANWAASFPAGVNALGGDDVISGSSTNDIVLLADGDDFFSGGVGDDTALGGVGDDKLFGGTGQDSLVGGEGNDQVFGGKGDDQLYGNQGNDQVFGDKGNDAIFGGRGNDTLLGGEGNDLLYGDLGVDFLTGGPGEDVFVLRAEDPSDNAEVVDLITDFQRGSDLIALTGGLTEANLQLELVTPQSGTPFTLIRNAATGGLLAKVLNTRPEDLRSSIGRADFVDYNGLEVRPVGTDKFELVQAGSDGSTVVTEVTKEGDRVFQNKVRYNPAPDSNQLPFYLVYSRDGSQIDLVREGGGRSSFRIQTQGSQVKVTEITPDGRQEPAGEFTLGDLGLDFARGLLNDLLCVFGKGLCQAFATTADMTGLLKQAGDLGIQGLSKLRRQDLSGVSSSALDEFDLLSNASSKLCTALFGSDAEVKEAIAGLIEDKIPLPSDLTSRLKLGDKIINFAIAADKRFSGKSRPSPSEIRKSMGFTLQCDDDPTKPTPPPPPPPTCDVGFMKVETLTDKRPKLGGRIEEMRRIEYGETINVQVTYCDPFARVATVEYSAGGSSPKKVIAAPSPSSGTVNIPIRIKPLPYGDCDDFEDQNAGGNIVVSLYDAQGKKMLSPYSDKIAGLVIFDGNYKSPTGFDSSAICSLEVL